MLTVPCQQIINSIHRGNRNVKCINVSLRWQWNISKQCFSKHLVIIRDFQDRNAIQVG